MNIWCYYVILCSLSVTFRTKFFVIHVLDFDKVYIFKYNLKDIIEI